jgi:hypothetical protein
MKRANLFDTPSLQVRDAHDGTARALRTNGPSKSTALKLPCSSTSNPGFAACGTAQAVLIGIDFRQQPLQSLKLRHVHLAFKDRFCTRCPVLSHTLATRRRRRRPALVSVFTS